MEFIGRKGSELLFVVNDKAVLVDENKKLVLAVNEPSTLVASFLPSGDQTKPESPIPFELAMAATTDLDIKVFSNNDRLYTIPKSIQSEAKRALDWHTEHHRGGTPVGLNTARTLARGGQIGIRKIRHIAKYFPRHEVDKKGKGYHPGEPNYPSNGRIAWALWGGDSAKSWASTIVERENRKAKNHSITASFDYVMNEYDNPESVQLQSFSDAENLPQDMAPQFYIRVRLDGSGIDRLYKTECDGKVFVWDDGLWEDLGNVNHDFITYDKSLDDASDIVEKVHVPVDTQAAIAISGILDARPLETISVVNLNPEESNDVISAKDGIEWELIDDISLWDEEDEDDEELKQYIDYSEDSLTAAGEGGLEGQPAAPAPSATTPNQDGNYTPQERSQKARGQVRDQTGKFAKAGGKVVIGNKSEYSGTIESVNPDTQTVKVKLDNGNFVDVPGNMTQDAAKFVPTTEQTNNPNSTKMLTQNILGEPRVPIDRPDATLPGRLPALTANQLKTVVTDMPAWIEGQRQAASNLSAPQNSPTPQQNIPVDKYQNPTGQVNMPNAYNDPFLREFLEKKVVSKDGTVTYPNAVWYRPDLAGIKPSNLEGYKDKIPTKEEILKTNPFSTSYQQPAVGFSKPTGKPATPTAPATTSNAPKKLANGVVQTGTKTEPIYTKDYNGSPVRTGQDGTPLKGTYVEIPQEGYKYGGVVVKQGESSNALNDKGELGAPTKTYEKNYDGVREYKSSDGTVFYGRKGVVVPAGKMMTSSGTIVDKPKTASALTAAIEQGATALTPENSDVPPLYMAIVAPDDPQAVMDLVSLIPANTKSTTLTTFKRKSGKWVQDDAILNDLNSPTPPPVVVLDTPTLTSVLEQVDKSVTASIKPDFSLVEVWLPTILAAGGIDKNKGNAEKLRRYWTYGLGAAKIRWGTGGDWSRCVRQLSKYLGPRAKGYCALRHKEVTGMWTGDKEHRQLYGHKQKADTFSNDFIVPSAVVVAAAAWRVGQKEIEINEPTEETLTGAEFSIPLVIPEAVESGDGRKFAKGAITMRELPLPLMWQIQTGEGHSGSVVVGKITYMERTDEGIGNAKGIFDSGEYGREAERLVRNGFIKGVSADMDQFEADQETASSENDSEDKIGNGKMRITKARVMGVTIVAKPAFQECKISIVEPAQEQEEKAMLSDGVYVEGVNPLDASALVACGLVAGMIPVTPPKEWFDNPKLTKPTALTVSDDGKVYGHIAAWHVDHIGMAFGTKPPRSRSNYAYFHTGVVRADDGTDMPVGQLTLAGGHASLEASAHEAVRHYDDTASAIADVHAGEDAYGIWVSGALRPGTTPEQIRSLRASAPSGDWRPIKGGLELVAVCQVNVPGFPIARARVASGQVMALVAAGASVLAQLKSDPLAELNARVSKVESVTTEPLVAAAQEAKNRMESLTAAMKARELSSKIQAMKDADSNYMLQMFDDTEEFAIIPLVERKKLAEEGKALPDGSFPIRNAKDLRNAVHAYGRSRPGKRGAVRRHIVKMARKLDSKDLIPENWTEASTKSVTASAEDMRSRIAAVQSVLAAGDINKSINNPEEPLPFSNGGQALVSATTADACPPATGNIEINLANRQKAIDTAVYGPLNPKEPNNEFWQEKATRWSVDVSEAKKSLCGNCVMFIRTPKMLDCIASGLESGDSSKQNAWDAIDTAELGFCEAFDFKCAASRTCNAWVVGGPITEEGKAVTAAGEEDQVSTQEPQAVEEKPKEENVLKRSLREDDLKGLTPVEIEKLKQVILKQGQKTDGKYVPGKTQPRDDSGKFRQVLARLKVDLGPVGADAAIKKIEEVENLDNAGNYLAATKSSADLLDILGRLDTKALNPESLENVRNSSRLLGQVISNLPFQFDNQAQKIRYSDVPPVLRDLMEKMIDKVNQKIGQKDGQEATKDLRSFMAGGDYYSQSEISSQMSTLLRLLT